MKVRSKFPSILFYGISSLFVLIAIISFMNALSWLNRPFPGFLLYKDPVLGSFGPKAGLKFLDRIVTVDGQPIRDGDEIVQAARAKRAGTPVKYLVETKGERREVAIPVAIFTLKDFFLIFFIIFLGGLIFYALGFIVYLMKPNMRLSWVFLVACFGQATYMVTGFEIQSSYTFVRFHYFVLSLYPAVLFHLGLIFPERKKVLNRFWALEYLIYLPASILAVAFLVHFSPAGEISDSSLTSSVETYIKLASLARFLLLFCVLGWVVLSVHSLFKATDIQSKQRARMILLGVTIGAAPCVMLMALAHFLKVYFPWNFMILFLVFFPASIAYSIIRHNLFDANAVIKRAVGYAVATAVVVGGYIGISVALNVFVKEYELSQSRAFPILFTLGVVLVFNPLRNRIQDLVDRIFFRKEYDYSEIIDRIGGAMTTLLDLEQVISRLIQTFMTDMFINTSSVMLLSPAGAGYRVFLADGEEKQDVEKVHFEQDAALMQIMEQGKKELTKYDILEDPKYRPVRNECAAGFDALHASLIVPLVYQDKVIGLLNLGEKKSGKPYKREDIDLLRSLAHQGAVAIENARLFKDNMEKQRMEEELNIARDLQMSMLPAHCPEIKGFKIAAQSIPAREVGGDFFDFIEMGESKMGLVVGDVTGKSVSGALVVAASRSVFRMLSEEQLSVGDIMIRANKRMKRDIKSGMFVALFYAVLDGRNKVLSFCSAGQTQPIYFSSKTGEVRLQETLGDKFPLGILDETDYQETQIRLEPGDRLVFYTDGIVEAMNANREIFGFDRVLEIVRKEKTSSADVLLHRLLEQVKEFSGGAIQHDDITIISVSVEE
jgi:sigma-B regulation protein RsbU (phosphoserine phosphatase)